MHISTERRNGKKDRHRLPTILTLNKISYFICILFVFLSGFLATGCDQIKISINEKMIAKTLAEVFPVKKYYLSYVVVFNKPSVSISKDIDAVSITVVADVSKTNGTENSVIGSYIVRMQPELKYINETGELYFKECALDIFDKKTLSDDFGNSAEDIIRNTVTTLNGSVFQRPFYILESKDHDIDRIISRLKLKQIKMKSGKIVLYLNR